MIRNISYEEAFELCLELETNQYFDEFGEFLEKTEGYLDKVKTILEIGSHCGGSLALLGRLMSGTPDDLLISISAGKIRFERVSELVYPTRVIQLDMYSQTEGAINGLRDILGYRNIDVLFIDADHSYEGSKADYINYHVFCKSKSVIGFHDIYWGGFGGVNRTFKELRRSYVTSECIRRSDKSGVSDWEITDRGIGILYKGGIIK
jgi:predicted O-methyltransferase YrrM